MKDLAELADALADAEAESFVGLIKIAGLDPAADFIGESLAGLDLRGEDLRGFNLSNADLTNTDLRGANLKDVSLQGAKTIGTLGLSQANAFDLSIALAMILSGEVPHLDWVPFITELSLDGSKLQNLSALSTLKWLRKLDISSTGVSDLSPLSSLLCLEDLRFSHTAVQDMSPLVHLVNLRYIDLSYTKVISLESIDKFQVLEELHCSGTRISIP